MGWEIRNTKKDISPPKETFSQTVAKPIGSYFSLGCNGLGKPWSARHQEQVPEHLQEEGFCSVPLKTLLIVREVPFIHLHYDKQLLLGQLGQHTTALSQSSLLTMRWTSLPSWTQQWRERNISYTVVVSLWARCLIYIISFNLHNNLEN
jgi:hypothetical protein